MLGSYITLPQDGTVLKSDLFYYLQLWMCFRLLLSLLYFWNMTPCTFVVGYQHFILKMETAWDLSNAGILPQHHMTPQPRRIWILTTVKNSNLAPVSSKSVRY